MSLELLNSIYTISNANLTKEWLSVNESISPQNLNNFKKKFFLLGGTLQIDMRSYDFN